MAAVEVPNPMQKNEIFISDVKEDNFQLYITKATELLLFKEFKQCIEICDAGIAYAKVQDDERVQQTLEALCVLAIQAYAELNSWQEVLPFIQNIYTSIECCPYKVIQLCLLLHAKVQEYPQCHALSSIWLHHPDNFSHPEYKDLVTTYIHFVLVPQNKMNIIPQFLDSCPGMKSVDKEQIVLQFSQISETEQENNIRNSKHLFETDEKSVDRSRIADHGKKKNGTDVWMIQVAKKIGIALYRSGSYFNLTAIIKIAAVAICLCLITVQATKGDTLSGMGYVTVLWQGALKLFKTMFGSPYQSK